MARRKKPVGDLDRLCEAMCHARKDLERFRMERRNAVRQYVGGHWSDEGPRQKVPVNLLALFVQIVSRSLISKAPRVMLSTFARQHKPAVAAMESWTNLQIPKMGLAETLQRNVLDAMFGGPGICKVSLMDPAHSSLWGWNTPAGTAFAERVSLDDFVFDTHARDFREASFIGHRYRVPLASVKDSSIYNKNRKDLQASTDEPHNNDGDERLNTMQRTNSTSPEYEDMVDLWEVWLPRTNTLVVLPHDAIAGVAGGSESAYDSEVLREWDWLGPDEGPYHFLAYGWVPDNAMPTSPIQNLVDLADVTNEVYLKLMRQAQAQKSLLTVQGAGDEDGNRIINASDGDVLRLDNPDKTKIANFNGPDQANLQFAIHLKDLFSYVAGNLDAMGGLSPQAKTLGQDRMLMQSASQTVEDMQETTINFVSKVCRALGWFWWHDPFKVMKSEWSVPGVPESAITREVYPAGSGQPLARDGDWDEIDLGVDPYSLSHQTPQQRVQMLLQTVQQIILPMQGILQQSGVGFDVVKLLEKIGKYGNMPDLAEIVTIQEPPAQGPAGAPESPGGQPAATSREYIRRSDGGNNAQTREATQANMTSPGNGPGIQGVE